MQSHQVKVEFLVFLFVFSNLCLLSLCVPMCTCVLAHEDKYYIQHVWIKGSGSLILLCGFQEFNSALQVDRLELHEFCFVLFCLRGLGCLANGGRSVLSDFCKVLLM